MEIQYRGCGPVVSRDIVGDDYAFWGQDEIKSVERGQRLRVRVREAGPDGEPIVRFEERDAAEAIFASGPQWVDVADGKNPNFVCAACGQTTTAEHFQPDGVIAYVDEHGGRLCIADFLRANPQYTEYHQRRGFDAAALEPTPAESGSALAIIAPKGAHTEAVDHDVRLDDAE